MKISVMQPALAKALAVVGRAVSSRSTLPVLQNLLLEAKQLNGKEGQLRLAATNLGLAVNCWIGGKVELEGALTIPARLLTEFVGSLPPDRIDLEVDGKKQSVKMVCGKFEATLKGIDAADYPFVPTMADPRNEGAVKATCEIDLMTLKSMIGQVVFAASTEESRPTLTAIKMGLSESQVAMAATDGFRLAVRSVAVPTQLSAEGDTVLLIPATSLSEVARICGSGDAAQPVSVMVLNQNQVLFRIISDVEKSAGFGVAEVVCNLIDANYPDYLGIVPKGYKTKTIVDTAALLKAVKVARLFARDDAYITRVQIIPGEDAAHGEQGRVVVRAKSSEMGDNESEIEAMVEGEALEIAFNADYLLEMVGQIDSPTMVIETSSATRPAVIYPSSASKEGWLYLIMPMQPR